MILYNEGDWHIRFIFAWNGSVVPKASCFAVFSGGVAILLTLMDEGMRRQSAVSDLQESQIWAVASAIILILLTFRTRQALGRFWEGTGLLHQMRGEWFDAVSCLMAFSRQAIKTHPAEVAEFRHTLVRLTSLMHGCALHEIKDEADEHFEVIDMQGLDDNTLQHLRFCKAQQFNLVEVLLHMIQVLTTENHERGIVKIPPPICSRVYQELSRGMVNLHNAKKITDTQFPFPYAQLIMVLLLLHSILTPIIVTAIVENTWWAFLITCVPVFGMFSVNLVATELEMPFGDDANDLPLHEFQTGMNNSLLMLIHDNADLLPCTTSEAVHDMTELKRTRLQKVDIDHVTTAELLQPRRMSLIDKSGIKGVARAVTSPRNS